MATTIPGEQIRDESITEDDIKDGSVKSDELGADAVSGHTTITSVDTSNDYLLIWDATDSTLKKVAPTHLGLGGGGGGISFDGSAANGVLSYKDSDEASVESNLTFNGTDLTVAGAGSIYVDKIRRASDSGTTTKILLNDEVIKLYAGDSSNNICTIDSTGLKIDNGSLETATIDYTDGDLSMTIADGGKVTFASGFAVGSDAAGDILYHNGTSYVRLAKGTADQVLTMNDGATAPGWETAAGGGSDSWIVETRGNFTATLQANKYYYNGLIGYNAGVLAVSISDSALATIGAKTLMQKAMMGVIPVNADLTEWKLTGFKDAGGSSNAVYDVNADIQLWKVNAYSNETDVTDPTLTNILDFTIDVDGDQLFTYGGTLSSGNSFSAGDGWFITVSRDDSGSAPYADHYWHLALKFEPS